MAVSKAKRASNKRWDSKNLKQLKLEMPIAEAEALQSYCDQKGIPRTTFIRKAVKEKMDREP